MTIYRLFAAPVFPNPEEADPDGLLAIGGDLSPQRLLAAYSSGIFPWYGPDSPILWWSTDPRLVLFPGNLHVPRSLRRVLNQDRFEFTMDTAFDQVVKGCAATPRPEQEGTWLVPDMVDAYQEMHRLGFAHSCEAWLGGELAGGVYGLGLGGVFFAESMFYRVPEASKAALVRLVRALECWGFTIMDCQQTTSHMLRFGAREISRREFLAQLARGLRQSTRRGPWSMPWAAKKGA